METTTILTILAMSFFGGFMGGIFVFIVTRLDFQSDFDIQPVLFGLLAVALLVISMSQKDKATRYLSNVHIGVCVMQVQMFSGENWCWPQ